MTAKAPLVHHRLGDLEASEDEFQFAGQRLTDIAKLADGRPFYAYDQGALSNRVGKLRNALPDYIELHYAIKANPMPQLVNYMAGLVDGLDVASAGELAVALNSSIAPSDISFAGPGKSDQDLADAVSAGITLNVESDLELRRLAGIGEKTGKRPSVAVRVNPAFELKTSGMKMGGGPKQFGIDEEIVPDTLKLIGQLGLEFQGFHIFSGSQNLKHEAICESQQKSVDLAIRLSEFAPGTVRQLNIGGGFGIPYFPGEKPLDIKPIADNLDGLHTKIMGAMPEGHVILELGRYLVGEAGIYVCRVVDRKVSRGQVFLVTDGGLHHHLAASGNFGQVIRKNYPVFVGTKVRGAEREVASVVGPLCTPLDLLADRMEMARADVGDLIVVMQSGAYGLTASPTAFLSHPLPVELFL